MGRRPWSLRPGALAVLPRMLRQPLLVERVPAPGMQLRHSVQCRRLDGWVSPRVFGDRRDGVAGPGEEEERGRRSRRDGGDVGVLDRASGQRAAGGERGGGGARGRGRGRGQGAAGLISMANVTRRNFTESLEQLKLHLAEANFVAVDLEMTGVESTKWRRNLELDSYETRYQNLKHSAEKFAVWQCGVCPFKWNDSEKKWIAYPYNFFVFARNELHLELPPRSFFAQTNSLEFLTKHRFDFNTCIYDGVSYLSHEQEATARVLMGLVPGKQAIPIRKDSDYPLTRSGDISFFEKIRSQIGKWRDELLFNQQKWQVTNEKLLNPSGSSPNVGNSVKDFNAGLCFGSLRPSLAIDVISHHQARLVKQVIRTHFPDLVPVVTAIGGNGPPDRSRIRIVYVSPKEDMAAFLQELADEERGALEARVSRAVGFRKVLDTIAASGLPVVGHNCILDMAHCYSKFFGALPSTAAEFCSSLREPFPCVFDTKYLLRAEPTLRGILASRSTSLAVVFTHICQGFADKAVASGRFYFGKGKILNTAFTKVAVKVAEEFQRYGGAEDTGLKHEAGFDAYMTGSVFAQACHLLQVDADTVRKLPGAVKAGEQGFASYANLLALGWAGNMVLDLATGKEATGVKALREATSAADRHPEHSTVALAWGFPSGNNEAEVRLLVQRVFNAERNFPPLNVTIVDDSSAFLHFRDPCHMLQFFRLMQGPRTSDSIPPSFRAALYHAYEHLCRSPLTSERLAESADILQLERFSPQLTSASTLIDEILHGKAHKKIVYASVELNLKQGVEKLYPPDSSDQVIGTSEPHESEHMEGETEIPELKCNSIGQIFGS